MGDVVDRRKFINFKTAHTFRQKFMKRLWEEGIDTHIILGNHDTYYKNTNEVNAITELCTTYDGKHEPWIYDKAKTVNIGGLDICFIPWICDENYEHSVKEIQDSKAQIAMGHLEIKGFEMHNGHISTTGLEKRIFRRFEMVLSGHFHKKSDDGQIYFLGSPYEFNWNDHNCPKGFHVFDTETRTIEQIRNPNTIHEKIYYNDEENNYKDFDFEKYKHKYVKLIVEKKKDYFLFDKFLDSFYKVDVNDVKVIEDYSDLDASTVADDIAERSEDTPTLLDNYIEQLETDLNKDKLKTLMKSLYTEAGDMEI